MCILIVSEIQIKLKMTSSEKDMILKIAKYETHLNEVLRKDLEKCLGT